MATLGSFRQPQGLRLGLRLRAVSQGLRAVGRGRDRPWTDSGRDRTTQVGSCASLPGKPVQGNSKGWVRGLNFGTGSRNARAAVQPRLPAGVNPPFGARVASASRRKKAASGDNTVICRDFTTANSAGTLKAKCTACAHLSTSLRATPMPRVGLVIFDLDGTLLNTEQLVAEVAGSVVQNHGKAMTLEATKVGVLGLLPLSVYGEKSTFTGSCTPCICLATAG